MSLLPDNLPYKWINTGIVAAFTGAALWSSVYTIEPNEAVNIRRFNKVVHDTPITESGPHFKLPFIDQVDKAQLSLRTLQIPRFYVNTLDNQRIGLDINFTYVLPASQVNRMLYDTGKTDDGEIDDNSDSIIPVAMDRAARVFARQNTTDISANREAIQAEVITAVFNDVRELFGLEPRTLQMGPPIYSNTFVDSNEDAAAAKNAAVAEENKRDSVQAIANQRVIEATGNADARIKRANGEAEAITTRAAANLQARILEAEGEKQRLLNEIAPFGDAESYIQYMERQVELKWNGVRSRVEVTGGAPGAAPVVVPVPGLRP